jgi:uncharacterized protein (UPF0210 family)
VARPSAVQTEASAHKPPVRAITAFVRLSPESLQPQLVDAVAFLRRAQRHFEAAGYTVQTVRVTTQSFLDYGHLSRSALADLFQQLEALAEEQGITIALGPAMRSDEDQPDAVELIAETIARSRHLSCNIIVGSEAGVHARSARAAAETMLSLAQNSPLGQANFNFAAIAMLPPYSPFFPGSYSTGADHQFALALESAGLVLPSVASLPDDGCTPRVASRLGQVLTDVERIAIAFASDTAWSYEGIDVSPAPGEGGSVGAAIEEIANAPFGSSGTLAAARSITRMLRDLPVKQVGYSGLMLPILEDHTLAQRWAEGRISIDALLAYSAVCGTGLDTVPLPGEISAAQLERMIADVATLAVTLRKPLSVRFLPVPGRRAGESTTFDDPRLVNSVLQPLP